MNSLYKLPLHGVACVPFCDPEINDVVYTINMSFSALTTQQYKNTAETQPDWLMSDIGERYKTEVSLYIQPKEERKADLKKSNTTAFESEYKETSVQKNNNQEYVLQINCQGKGQFTMHKNTINTYWNTEGTDSAHYFQTIGLALWLELNKVLCIHANALAYKDKAIALVAPSRTGKTTLTAELCKSEFALMTDDMMALHHQPEQVNTEQYKVYPSWPVARMWPETLSFIQNVNDDSASITAHKKVHEQFDKRTVNINQQNGFNFCNTPKALHTIYLLNRINNENKSEKTKVCNITTISSAKAVILLIQNSILGSGYAALGLEKTRIQQITQLLTHIKFKQIDYISGKLHLNEVKNQIMNDLANS